LNNVDAEIIMQKLITFFWEINLVHLSADESLEFDYT